MEKKARDLFVAIHKELSKTGRDLSLTKLRELEALINHDIAAAGGCEKFSPGVKNEAGTSEKIS